MGVEPAGPETLLRAEGLRQVYDGRVVVEVEAIEVRAGEVLALLGPNGAGKSTLMRLLAGLEKPERGRLYYKGRAVEPGDRELRAAAVAVLQRPYLWRGTVRYNVEYGLRVRGIPAAERRSRAGAALDTLGARELEEVPVNALSGGEAQRVALARALAPRPEILFLDEPTADLDVTVRRLLLADLERIVSDAAPAVVLITHDAAEAFALANRVAVFEEGRIVQTGTPAEIFESPATEFVASFTGAEFLLSGEIAETGDGTVMVRLDTGQRVEVQGSGDAGLRVKVAYRPEDVVVVPAESSAQQTSARNRYPARVAHLNPSGGLVRLRLEADGLRLEAMITRHALEELRLEVGSRVVAQIKATALHTFPI